MNNIKNLLTTLRRRLTEYRFYRIDSIVGEQVSIDVNAVEIALGITEYMIYRRSVKILDSDLKWFKADYHITLIFEDSEWEDIATLYRELVEELRKNSAIPELKLS